MKIVKDKNVFDVPTFQFNCDVWTIKKIVSFTSHAK